MEEEQFHEKLLQFCNNLKAQSPISSFLLDYMAIVQNILSFIRASREGNWLLHLATLKQLCPLFFSQNRLKYAQHVPEYLAKMYHLQETDPEIWDEFSKGNFSVSKGDVGFTSIGVDHALEQENRKMKVLGGLKGISQKPNTLTRFFLAAPELARLARSVEDKASIAQAGRKHHHDLSVSSARRQQQNITQLTAVTTASSPFKGESGDLVNIVTKSVMPDSVKVDILARHEAGEKAYSKFVADRIIGTVNLWDKMSKVKLQCWKTAAKKVRVKTESRVIELQENRSLFARMAIAGRSRPDIDIKDAIEKHEFSSLSRALFASDGKLLPCEDKSKLLQILEQIPDEPSNEVCFCAPSSSTSSSTSRVILIDAMVLVQQIAASKMKLKSCKEFAELHIKAVERMISQYDKVHVVFDHYDVKVSLKEMARQKRNCNVTDTRTYVCSDETPINTSLSTFIRPKFPDRVLGNESA